jgi:hypothetical protein
MIYTLKIYLPVRESQSLMRIWTNPTLVVDKIAKISTQAHHRPSLCFWVRFVRKNNHPA